MDYKINRLSKAKSRTGEDEVFLEIIVTDDLGTYPYGKWLNAQEVAQFKAQFSPADYEAATRLSEFKFLCPDLSVLHTIITSHIPLARKQKEDQLWQENYERDKLARELQAPVQLSQEEKDLMMEQMRLEIKEQLKAEILNELKDS